MNWTVSVGTIQYQITQYFPNGTHVDTFVFNVTEYFVVSNLPAGVLYVFTLYSGNQDGFDTSFGPSVTISTGCELSPFFLTQHLTQTQTHATPTIIPAAFYCAPITEGHVNWPGAVAGGPNSTAQCLSGYGGKPTRVCNPPDSDNQNQPYGVFGAIALPCIQCK